jgi:CheY-like chemotaxis protein
MEKKYDYTASKDKGSDIPEESNEEGSKVHPTTSKIAERIEHFHALKNRLPLMEPSAKLLIKIAIIDDMSFNLAINSHLVNSAEHPRYEFQAIIYKFPEEVQNFLDEFTAGGIDAVLTDWDMPSPLRDDPAGMQGSEVLDFVKNRIPEMPVTVNTASPQAEQTIRAAGGGFILKPVSTSALRSEFIKSCVKYCDEREEIPNEHPHP